MRGPAPPYLLITTGKLVNFLDGNGVKRQSRMLNLSFRIGGNYFHLTTNDRMVLRKTKHWLNFFTYTEDQGQEGVELRLLCGDQSPPLLIPEGAEHIYSGYLSEHFLHDRLWLIDFQGRGWMRVEREREKAVGFVQRCYLQKEPWVLEVLLHPISEILRKRGLYLSHSGAVSLGEKGVVIAGPSQAGKTTLVLHLIAKGFRFLSDDRCFLRRNASGFEVLAFPEEVRVYPPNVADLPEFQFLKGNAHSTTEKSILNIQEVYPDCLVDQAKIKAILFPRWNPAGRTHFERISSSNALIEMLPLTLEFRFPDTAQVHFEFVADLVERVPCCVLSLGNDKERWSELVQGLIQ